MENCEDTDSESWLQQYFITEEGEKLIAHLKPRLHNKIYS